jgi:hypothetical protein
LAHLHGAENHHAPRRWLTGDTIDDGKGCTVTFGFDGAHYEFDLTDDNADALREAFSDYVAAARKVSGPRKPCQRREQRKAR